MRQAVLILVVFAAALLTGCGGGGSSKSSSSTAAASIALSASSLSLNQGDVTTITASVLDSSGAALASPPTVTFASDAPTVATVGSTTGSICAGVWDANFVVCTPGPAGTAKITATTGSLSASTTVYVHKKLDRIVINTPTGICKSVGQTLQLSATAFSGGADVTSTVGPLT